ncbi:ABC transporter ATP-binding protein [Limibacter armeniacum]|uniref:ABC transporter ATP-binding protein n=1 Tax=Limibacter armeniacum TaxID=466084 RepID=UPI002FE4FFCF
MIKVQHLGKAYDEKGKAAITDVSFEVEQGEIFALIGESGCGKSTTLRCMAGLEQPSEGEVQLRGERIIGPWEQLIAGHPDIKLVAQSYDLFPNMSVWENIKHPIRKYTKEYQQYRISELMRLCRLEGLENKTPEHLSGGEQQRVAFACALSDEPAVLLMDEPFSNLDIPVKTMLRREVKRMVKESGTTVVFVSHDTSDALAIADRVAVMKDGEILQVGTPKQIYSEPANSYIAGFFPYANILSWNDALNVLDLSDKKASAVCIRPESVRISVAHDEQKTKAKVIDVEYAGADDFLILETVKGTKLHAKANAFEFDEQDDVYIHIDDYYLLDK